VQHIILAVWAICENFTQLSFTDNTNQAIDTDWQLVWPLTICLQCRRVVPLIHLAPRNVRLAAYEYLHFTVRFRGFCELNKIIV